VKRYIFSDQAEDRELARLRLVEAAFDPKTQAWLGAAGVGAGKKCLEIAAGAGSIAKWMSERCGEVGGVTAVDLATRYLSGLTPQVRVIEGDATSVDLGGPYEVAHCRYMLIHNPNAQTVVDRVRGALATGSTFCLKSRTSRLPGHLVPSRISASRRRLVTGSSLRVLIPALA